MTALLTMTKNKPSADKWERQKSESSKAYAAFCSYRDMGVSRSLVKIVNIVYGESTEGKLSVNLRQLSTWSSKYGWVARVEAYDDYLESKLRRDNELAIEKMARRHTEASMMAVDKAVDRIKMIGEKNTEELTPKEALEYLKVAAELERKSRGAPDQVVEHGGNIGISRIEIATSKREDDEDESKV